MTIIFNIIWSLANSICGSSNRKNREIINKFIKTKIIRIYVNFPIDGDIFEYYVDYKLLKLIKWEVIIPDFKYNLK